MYQDEKIYALNLLEENSKEIKKYDYYDNWINLNNYIKNLNKFIEQIKQTINDEKKKNYVI